MNCLRGKFSRFAFALLAVAMTASIAEAQGRSQETLRKNYQKKLEKPFVGKVNWARTLEEAKERARVEKKPILGYFTRSYAP